ncbi:5-oxoprolinase subunit B family protein [Aneurinibacillus thermoaerophilus]|uniref:Carboxyltransferase domain-containing protein n=1 Tax=Aneurinibacillus thermoaerophilus TaxID=143495 RepID=A0A1G7Y346_ANETH|nr:carboxyltransferase domain-containing protein [Aneurinibacillus thermoaerophilus]MED0737582.1 carboxyltransferase domain-containing protein [Aneurinibacillus thermoaerophilus]MED0758153.1 carboxyltransferase domain-containing protein [Aneurinibacillus thermoaerophilus]MED0761307.1 carboxyltransferase domain-containing protein [Aneurinibacillus thermoaerophilus]QYY41336.1 carboxyltransferase domain-containing protein [Aneurinibacillus thermoaerophilus]SDG90696.1 urea carboxylase [Aneurinibac
MFTLPETRFDFGGDEYIYAEISRDMSAESNFKALAIVNELRKRNIPGIIEIVPSNASYLVRYNPEIIPARDLLDYLKDIDITKSNPAELNLSVRMVEIPVWYDDPITREYSRRFKSRHQEPDISNFEFAMKVNGFREKEAFIEAHTRMPYLITMVGFLPGTAWGFPLGLHPQEIIQVPKYLSPRTDTPRQAVGVGGAFTVVYPVNGPGSYQLIGISAVPVYDNEKRLVDLEDTYFLARPGDIWKYRSVDEREYSRIVEEVKQGTYRYRMKYIEFSPQEYVTKGKVYIRELMEGF